MWCRPMALWNWRTRLWGSVIGFSWAVHGLHLGGLVVGCVSHQSVVDHGLPFGFGGLEPQLLAAGAVVADGADGVVSRVVVSHLGAPVLDHGERPEEPLPG